jgi:Icc-related predicted phosphoesterase
VVEYGRSSQRVAPAGGIDLHRRVVRHGGVLLAGVEGSVRYRPGPYQYSQIEMWLHVASLIPALWVNRLRYGRFLDILVSHAAPLGVHDQPDLPHQGIAALRWLDRIFQPRLHLHGHIHRIGPREPVETLLGVTRVVNVYSFQELELAGLP